MRSITAVSILCSLLCGHGVHAAEPPVLDASENAHWDAGTDAWFVSNLGDGPSLAKDGIGWVARFDAAGAVIDPRGQTGSLRRPAWPRMAGVCTSPIAAASAYSTSGARNRWR